MLTTQYIVSTLIGAIIPGALLFIWKNSVTKADETRKAKEQAEKDTLALQSKQLEASISELKIQLRDVYENRMDGQRITEEMLSKITELQRDWIDTLQKVEKDIVERISSIEVAYSVLDATIRGQYVTGSQCKVTEEKAHEERRKIHERLNAVAEETSANKNAIANLQEDVRDIKKAIGKEA